MEMPVKHVLAAMFSFLFVFSAIGIVKNHNHDDISEVHETAVVMAWDDYYDEEYILEDIVSYAYGNTAAAGTDKIASTTAISSQNIPIVTTPQETVTYVVSKKGMKYDKNSVYLDIRSVLQLPELPVGCEATALTMVLNYYGFKAEKTDIAKNYLPQSTYWFTDSNNKVYINNYNDFFMGDPFGRGYGCFSNCIVKTAKKYIAENGGGYSVKNVSDSKPSELYTYVAKGIPVICWGTTDMCEPIYTQEFYDIKTGEDITWLSMEHCFVLVGFNIKDKTVTINDPQRGIVTHDMKTFETRYRQMHSQAVIITEDKPVKETTVKKTTKATTKKTTAKTTTATTAPTSVTKKVDRTSVKVSVTTVPISEDTSNSDTE